MPTESNNISPNHGFVRTSAVLGGNRQLRDLEIQRNQILEQLLSKVSKLPEFDEYRKRERFMSPSHLDKHSNSRSPKNFSELRGSVRLPELVTKM